MGPQQYRDEVYLTGCKGTTKIPVTVNKSQKKEELLERVFTPSGSVAGAGSDFFHKYRLFRNLEIERVKTMNKEGEEEEIQEEFQRQRVEAMLKDESRRAPKRERRKRQKEKIQKLRKLEREMKHKNKNEDVK